MIAHTHTTLQGHTMYSTCVPYLYNPVHNWTHIYDNPYNDDRARQTGERNTPSNYPPSQVMITVALPWRFGYKVSLEFLSNFFIFISPRKKEKNEKKNEKLLLMMVRE